MSARYLTTRNGSAAVQANGSASLTYAPQVNPSPLTASFPGQNPLTASLFIVVTNETGSEVTVQSIDFNIAVGTSPVSSPPLMIPPLTANVSPVQYSIVSPNDDWTFSNITGDVSGQMVTFSATPPSSDNTLAAGASVAIQLSDIPLTDQPCASTVVVNEVLAASSGSVNLQIPVLSSNFYLDWLMVVDQSGTPVTEVQLGEQVTLQWNCSQTDLNCYTILQSTLQGQQIAKPSTMGSWTSPPLLQDASFIVEVQNNNQPGAPFAALAIRVSVINPSLFASSLVVGGTTALSQMLFVEQGLCAQTIGGNSQSRVKSLTAASSSVPQCQAQSADVSGTAQIHNPQIKQGATVSGNSEFQQLRIARTASIFSTTFQLQTGVEYTTNVDGLLLASRPGGVQQMAYPSQITVTGPDGPTFVYPNDAGTANVGNAYAAMIPIRANSTFSVSVPGNLFEPPTLAFVAFGTGQSGPSPTSSSQPTENPTS